MTSETPILVVGAGPTGLTMACELARHGAPVRIIDKLPGIVPWCRATGVHARSLEIFQDLGVADAFVDEGQKVLGVSQFANGKRFLHARFAAVDSPYPFTVAIGQNRTEQILEELLNRLGVEVERETELVGTRERLDGLDVSLRRADGSEELCATPWLVACDGAHSTVRHLNRQHFPGEMDPHTFIIADVVFDAPLARDEWYAWLSDRGVFLSFPLPAGRSLLGGTLPPGCGDRTAPPTIAEIQTLVDEQGPGSGARVRDPRWLSCFHVHYRHTRHYRHGRTLLAGDAAHVHSFLGGLGMNTGIQDAYNLAWKLALVTRGCAPLSLLDSYEKERWAVAEDVVSQTRAMTDALEGFGALDEAQRERLLRQAAVPEAERMDMARHGEELDLDYRKSPICSEHVGRHGFEAGPHAGAQAVDVPGLRLAGRRTSLFELLRGPKHGLLLFPGRDPTVASLAELAGSLHALFGDVIDVFRVDAHGCPGARGLEDPDRALRHRYGATGECLYLIRPDGYVGYRSRPASLPALREYLERIFLPGSEAR
jgi:2-polyprenyl-6-methoxyphenol hydroxylase-like FAD-dependent oxidoreductase